LVHTWYISFYWQFIHRIAAKAFENRK